MAAEPASDRIRSHDPERPQYLKGRMIRTVVSA